MAHNASTIDGHLKIPPQGAFDAPAPEHSKNIRLRRSTQATTRQGAPRGAVPAIRGSTGWPIGPIFSGYLVA